jgi:hypothetical protein
MSVGRQLMSNSNYDTRGLDGRLAALEQDWQKLETNIGNAEQQLHQVKKNKTKNKFGDLYSAYPALPSSSRQ